MKRKVRRNLSQAVAEGLQLLLKDVMSAKWAIMVIVAYFVFLKFFLYSLCPMVLLTGFPCPGCGLTRAAFRILRLDFAGAWSIHPFIYAVIALAVIFMAERYLLQSKSMKVSKWCGIVVMAGMLLFYLWRMAHFFPDTAPMTYYRHNLLQKVCRMFIDFR